MRPAIAIPFPTRAPDFLICAIPTAPVGIATAERANDKGAARNTRKQQIQLPIPHTSAQIPVISDVTARPFVRCEGIGGCIIQGDG